MKRAGKKTREDNLKSLLAQRERLVPFIGAGFSAPACPSWPDFLDQYFQGLRGEFLCLKEEKQYRALKGSKAADRFEKMADWLIEKSRKGEFYNQVKASFDQRLLPEMEAKFRLLHLAFPALKVTSNYDPLIEDSCPGSHVETCRGSQHTEFDRILTDFKENYLLKIHGGVRDMSSIVLSSDQYAALYGQPTGFDIAAPLPACLKRLFTNFSLVFIGCSLVYDRTLLVLKSLEHIRPHFALLRRPADKKGRIELNRRLSELNITPVWLADYREIAGVLQKLVPAPARPIDLPQGPTSPFVGRHQELHRLEQALCRPGARVHTISGRLFNFDGAGGVGKTTLALEAARRFGHLFPDGVLPLVRADEHTPVSFAMQLARFFNLAAAEPADEKGAQALVTAILKERRVLVILDNVTDWESLRCMLPLESAAGIIVTTRNRDMHKRIRVHFPGLQVEEIALERFSRPEALALFRAMLDKEYRPEEEGIYLEIAENLGFLPIVLGQAISLMLFGPHYQAAVLLDKLKGEERLDLLRKGQAVDTSDARAVEVVFDLSSPLLGPALLEALEYLAVCAAGAVDCDFLAQLSKDKNIAEELEGLYTLSWCERRQEGGARAYELHQLVRELVNRRFNNPFRLEFCQLVHEIFTDEAVHFSRKDRLVPQLEEAFCLLAGQEDGRLKDWMYKLYYFCTRRGYADFYMRLTRKVAELFPADRWSLRAAYGNRALVLKSLGKLAEAMKLHKKQEKICEELGDRAGLAGCYGNQAGILYTQGHLKESMNLYKEQEKICEELGDRAGLAGCYGNQALILKAWGKLEEAMDLHKKQEKICEELGDRAQMSRSYCGQALILKAWGKLEEAMDLHKREEKICEELGDRAGLARSYGNQAGILYTQGHLKEAMNLYKEQEKISEELGDLAGLAISWWNQGIILGDQGNQAKKIELWQQSIAMNKRLGIPTEKYEKKLHRISAKK